MSDCVFCKIIKGEIPSYKVYEDENVFAFLDIANDIAGHTLVVPKKHCINVMDCPDRTLGKVISAVKKIGNHYVQSGFCEGFNILNNSERGALVKHLHFHVFPKKADSTFDLYKPETTRDNHTESLEEIANILKFENENVQTGEGIDYSKYVEDCDVLYTDGACSGNPGKGGYGAVLLKKDGSFKEFSGGEEETTNNRMEIMAVIEGLSATEMGATVKVYSDSAYVVNAFNQSWLTNWIKNGWKTSNKKEVLNQELWKELIQLSRIHNIHWNKVKGHSDNELNNRCDELARNEVEKILKNK